MNEHLTEKESNNDTRDTGKVIIGISAIAFVAVMMMLIVATIFGW